jgi:hypothetical protein
MFAKTLQEDLHKLTLPTNYTLTMLSSCGDMNSTAKRREYLDEKTRIRQKFPDIWRQFTPKPPSEQIHSLPAYIDDVSVPNRQVRPVLTRPNPFTADVKRLYTINEVN